MPRADTPAAAAVVRAWARTQGLDVGARGRLSPALLAAYEAAHAGPEPSVRPLDRRAPAAAAAQAVQPSSPAGPVVRLPSTASRSADGYVVSPRRA